MSGAEDGGVGPGNTYIYCVFPLIYLVTTTTIKLRPVLERGSKPSLPQSLSLSLSLSLSHSALHTLRSLRSALLYIFFQDDRFVRSLYCLGKRMAAERKSPRHFRPIQVLCTFTTSCDHLRCPLLHDLHSHDRSICVLQVVVLVLCGPCVAESVITQPTIPSGPVIH